MKCFIVFAMSLVVGGQSAAAESVPLRGSASSDYAIDFSKTININCDYDLDGDGQPDGGQLLTIPGTHQGKFSHLGKTSGDSVVTYNTCNATYDMVIDFKAANGDMLHLEGSGFDDWPPGPDGFVDSFGAFEILGGTGRFENASGQVNLDGHRFDDLSTGTSFDTFVLTGEISTVGSAQSAAAVPEPASLTLLGMAGLLLCRRPRSRG